MANRGNIVVAVTFALLLAAAGLSLLTNTATHLQIVAARKSRRTEIAGSERALILALHRYREKLAGTDMNLYQAPEIDFFNTGNFPAANDAPPICHEFRHFSLSDGDDFCITRILDLIRAGKANGQAAASSRAGVDLVVGDIPAGEFGLLIARKNDATAAAFLAAHDVAYAGSQLPLVGDFAVVADAKAMLAEALRIAIPDWRGLREKFALEPSDAPIPSGIYLTRDEEEVGAVFVEGDLDKLVFAAAAGWQSLVFSQGGHASELRYRPGLESLVWNGGANVGGARFGEKIFVHGSVWAVEQAGAAAFLDEARIELLACGRLVVRSGLESENLDLRKTKFPSLLLMTCREDFAGNETSDTDVVIDVADEATVQAQVLAAGALVNKNKEGRIAITGGVFAKDIVNDGLLEVGAAPGDFDLDRHVHLPDFKFLKNFRVHFIEENCDEDQ